tara:strand:- start:17 stop:466 length:450 start_codon:yes stop_codon:yes gene_type:complete
MVVELRLYDKGYRQSIAWLKHIQKVSIPGVMKRISRTSAMMIRDSAIRNIRNRVRYHTTQPGRLINSLKVEAIKVSKRGVTYSVRADAPYAGHVEAGTKPHFIPFGLGRLKGVDHPGARPMWFMRDALDLYIKGKLDTVMAESTEMFFK